MEKSKLTKTKKGRAGEEQSIIFLDIKTTIHEEFT
jgi:hypothetical protein